VNLVAALHLLLLFVHKEHQYPVENLVLQYGNLENP
jgi:hypothetical protein